MRSCQFPLTAVLLVTAVLIALPAAVLAQQPPYDIFPPADPPYYRVRYEGSTQPGELVYPVNYTIWIPTGAESLRGLTVHPHGCGEGSCKSGLTGAYDLHWQALAKNHDCALLAPAYEQPEKADCQMWCDPRNGSDAAFQKCLAGQSNRLRSGPRRAVRRRSADGGLAAERIGRALLDAVRQRHRSDRYDTASSAAEPAIQRQ